MSDIALRPFDPSRDFPGVVELISEVNANAGAGWFPTVAGLTVDWSRARSFDPYRDISVAEEDGRIMGAVRVAWREREGAVVHRVDVWVDPGRTRRGIGRTLLAWGEARAGASAADGSGGPNHLPHQFGTMTDQANAVGVAFAEKAGYRPIRYHYEMRRDLADPIPEVAVPDGIEVRPVTPADHRAVWLADAEAFRDHWDAAVVNEDDFNRFFAHPDIDPSIWQVAWDGNQVAGLVINGINRDENARLGIDVGWLDSVATRRTWRRRDVAGTPITQSLAVLRKRGRQLEQAGRERGGSADRPVARRPPGAGHGRRSPRRRHGEPDRRPRPVRAVRVQAGPDVGLLPQTLR
jgi:GNAT superfamily N-acetyltransferase